MASLPSNKPNRINPYILWSFILFFSLNLHGQNLLRGKWIESHPKDEVPVKMDFHPYYFVVKNNYEKPDSIVYHLIKDTLIFSNNKRIVKLLVKHNNGKLSLSDAKKHKTLIQLKKNHFSNVLEYYNEEFHTSIKLPRLKEKLKKLKFEYRCNIYLVQYNEQKNIEIIHKEKRYALDSLNKLFHSLNKLYMEYELSMLRNYLFIDRNIKLSDLQLIKDKFRKAGFKNFIYIYEDDSKKLFQTSLKLRRFPDPLDSLILQQVNKDFSGKITKEKPENPDFLLTKITARKIFLNGKKIKEKDWLQYIKNRLKKKDDFIILVYFDDRMNFNDYLKKFVQLKNIYEEIRNAYAHEKLRLNDYRDATYEKSEEIIKRFPFNYKEINAYEYKKIQAYLKEKGKL